MAKRSHAERMWMVIFLLKLYADSALLEIETIDMVEKHKTLITRGFGTLLKL